MYSTHNEDKQQSLKCLTKHQKLKSTKKMTADDSTSYLPYLNKLVDQYNNTYHYSIKKPINADYSVLTEKIEMNSKPPKFKENGGIRITIITT